MTDPLQATLVVVRRVRPRADGDRELDGFMTSLPRVGQSMSIYSRDSANQSRAMRTTPVRRILVEESGLVAFVETANSVYRIAFDRPFAAEPPAAAVRVRLSFDGSELTVFPEAEAERPRRSSGFHPTRRR